MKGKNILITGGAGFIGSHLVRFMVNQYTDTNFINLDLLTYAGNTEKLKDIENTSNYHFINGDIADAKSLKKLFIEFEFDGVIHLAAESHVDQSIKKPFDFAQTNVIGTLTLLETARRAWEGNYENKLFYHVSTDEVYGSLGEKDKFLETTSYDPRSPYSASKAASDHFVRAYFHTYGLPVILSNCSNNYGPDQYPEKLIPLIIQNIVQEKPLPVYGNMVANQGGSRTTIGGINNGSAMNSLAGSFDGELSNAQVWNKSLSSSNATSLYNTGIPLTTNAVESSNLVCWNKLDIDDTFTTNAENKGNFKFKIS